jgi:hypothetical protein
MPEDYYRHMDLTKLSSKDLAAISRLLEKRESLQTQIDKIDSLLNAYSGGASRPLARSGGGKRANTGRGELKTAIVGALQAAGKAGLTVKELAGKAGVKPANVYSWFYATGKKIKDIKKVGEAKYAWVG